MEDGAHGTESASLIRASDPDQPPRVDTGARFVRITTIFRPPRRLRPTRPIRISHARHAQSRTARGGHAPRGPAAGDRRRGQRQDARIDHAHRLAHPGAAGAVAPHPRVHVHEQGRARDAGPGAPHGAGVGGPQLDRYLPRDRRADPAARGGTDRLRSLLHDLRRRRPTGAGQADPQRHEGRSQAVQPARGGERDQPAQERVPHARAGAGAGDHATRRDGCRRVPALRAAPARDRRHGLRRPDRPDRRTVRGAPRRAGALRRTLRARARRRVPGHQPSPAGDDPRTERGPWQPVRGGRRRPVDLLLARGHGREHARLRAVLPGLDAGAAGTELSQHVTDPARGERGHRAQPAPQGQEPVESARRRLADRTVVGRGRRGRRPARARPDPQPTRRDRRPAQGHRDPLPHQRAEPRAGRRPAARGDPVPDHRRHAVLRTARGARPARLPEARAEPGRRDRTGPRVERAQTRDRQDDGHALLRAARVRARERTRAAAASGSRAGGLRQRPDEASGGLRKAAGRTSASSPRRPTRPRCCGS